MCKPMIVVPMDCSVDISDFHNPPVCLRQQCRRIREEHIEEPLLVQNTNIHTQSIAHIYILGFGEDFRPLNWHGICAENTRSILSVLQCSRKCEICDMGTLK